MSQLSAFKAMKDGFAQRGLDLSGILEEAGLNPDPNETVDAEQLADIFSVAWGAAVARTGDPAIGLALCPRQPLIGLGSLSSLDRKSTRLNSSHI